MCSDSLFVLLTARPAFREKFSERAKHSIKIRTISRSRLRECQRVRDFARGNQGGETRILQHPTRSRKARHVEVDCHLRSHATWSEPGGDRLSDGQTEIQHKQAYSGQLQECGYGQNTPGHAAR